jgi:molybdopterin synthase catalytic subunit
MPESAAGIRITVRLFAILRERAGVAETMLQLPGGANVREAQAVLIQRFPALNDVVRSTAYAINRSYVPATTILRDGDELALIPPVSGG